MGARVVRHGQERSEPLELHLVSSGNVFRAQVLEHGSEQGETPLPVIKTLRRIRVCESALIPALGGDEVDRQRGKTTSALHGPHALALVENEVLARRQEKGAKPSA